MDSLNSISMSPPRNPVKIDIAVSMLANNSSALSLTGNTSLFIVSDIDSSRLDFRVSPSSTIALPLPNWRAISLAPSKSDDLISATVLEAMGYSVSIVYLTTIFPELFG